MGKLQRQGEPGPVSILADGSALGISGNTKINIKTVG